MQPRHLWVIFKERHSELVFSLRGPAERLNTTTWWGIHMNNTTTKGGSEIRKDAASWCNSPLHALFFITPASREQLSHTYTEQTMPGFRQWFRTKYSGSFVSCTELDPHQIRLTLRGKLIFCYYFSRAWCKIAHYISKTELLRLANWNAKVITPWIYTASSFVSIENWSNKAK